MSVKIEVYCGCNPYQSENGMCQCGCNKRLEEENCTYTSAARGYTAECFQRILSDDPAEMIDLIKGMPEVVKKEFNRAHAAQLIQERVHLILEWIEERGV